MRWNSSRKDPQNQSANFLVASGHKLASNYRWLSFWIVPCPSNPVNMALLSKCIIIENYLHQLCVYLAGWAREKRKIHPQGKFWLFTQDQRAVKMPRWLGSAHPNWCCQPPYKMMVSLLVIVVLIQGDRCSNVLLLVTLELELLLVGL